ncbi:MAG: hypothetical protein IT236_12800 [Bacteroidia bacterium]|nr:hypothetical protein [Bacteroidia bacterium]
MGNDHPYSELRDKLIAGTKLAFERLVEKAKLTDDYLVFSENGKIVKVKARTINTSEKK